MIVRQHTPGLKYDVDFVYVGHLIGHNSLASDWSPDIDTTRFTTTDWEAACRCYARWLRVVTLTFISPGSAYSELARQAREAPHDPGHPEEVIRSILDDPTWGTYRLMVAGAALAAIPPSATLVCDCEPPHCYADTIVKALDYLDRADRPSWYRLRDELVGTPYIRHRQRLKEEALTKA